MGADGWLILLAVPICGWIAWSDLSRMRIPNQAVLALIAVFLVIGPLIHGWGAVALRVALQFGPVLLLGFTLFAVGLVGAGDAKVAAAIALYVAPGDGLAFLLILSASLVAAVALHRGVRRIPAARGLAPDWASWERREFPMGFPLAVALVIYLLVSQAS